MYGNVPPGQLGKADELPEDVRAALGQINHDVQSVRRHLIFLEEKQDKHEALTAELVHLYRGAGILGKFMAWIVGIGGSIGSLIMIFGDKK